MANVDSGEEILLKASINLLSRVHQRYKQADRRQTDRQTTNRRTDVRQQRSERKVVTFG